MITLLLSKVCKYNCGWNNQKKRQVELFKKALDEFEDLRVLLGKSSRISLFLRDLIFEGFCFLVDFYFLKFDSLRKVNDLCFDIQNYLFKKVGFNIDSIQNINLGAKSRKPKKTRLGKPLSQSRASIQNVLNHFISKNTEKMSHELSNFNAKLCPGHSLETLLEYYLENKIPKKTDPFLKIKSFYLFYEEFANVKNKKSQSPNNSSFFYKDFLSFTLLEKELITIKKNVQNRICEHKKRLLDSVKVSQISDFFAIFTFLLKTINLLTLKHSMEIKFISNNNDKKPIISKRVKELFIVRNQIFCSKNIRNYQFYLANKSSPKLYIWKSDLFELIFVRSMETSDFFVQLENTQIIHELEKTNRAGFHYLSPPLVILSDKVAVVKYFHWLNLITKFHNYLHFVFLNQQVHDIFYANDLKLNMKTFLEHFPNNNYAGFDIEKEILRNVGQFNKFVKVVFGESLGSVQFSVFQAYELAFLNYSSPFRRFFKKMFFSAETSITKQVAVSESHSTLANFWSFIKSLIEQRGRPIRDNNHFLSEFMKRE